MHLVLQGIPKTIHHELNKDRKGICDLRSRCDVGNYNSIWKLSQAWFHERLILQNHLILHQTSIVLLAPRRQIMGLHAKIHLHRDKLITRPHVVVSRTLY